MEYFDHSDGNIICKALQGHRYLTINFKIILTSIYLINIAFNINLIPVI